MNLKEHYRKLYNESIHKILSDGYKTDDLIDSKSDRRFGITLLIRPPDKTKDNIQKLLNELKIAEPDQYYYPNSDIHITVMSIISCYDGFDIKKIELPRYIELIKKCLPDNKNLKIQFKGLTASDSCIMLQGFTNNDSLNEIRNNLRAEFKNTTLEQSLDKRYPIQTAHSTIVRFRKHFQKKDLFLKIIDRYVDRDFGSFEVKKLELVYNDWYQRKESVKKLYEFEI
ncbi:2'-5' RNA ligase family protein [Sinomicrobium soli]|uniref:2'-5' RNA ligase family protein n=1 Tax=Sinomicrobium sp. N-1-3-6 TaxID=2219864 RepID=UPI000DCBBA64|nr:mutarotase [Sinomicrobium sp. N-1-3-6]RAV28618.1 mutarotase [Sinomicrobium sp. N-1-3-6]